MLEIDEGAGYFKHVYGLKTEERERQKFNRGGRKMNYNLSGPTGRFPKEHVRTAVYGNP